MPTGSILLRLERTADFRLCFLHSTPGTGTRTATVDLTPLQGREAIRVYLVWSPHETRLQVGDAERPGPLLSGVGEPSEQHWRLGTQGDTFQVGDEGVDVMGARVFEGGKPVLEPTAREAWQETIKAVNVLLTGSSEAGHLFDVVRTNLIIVALVTGFEAYCETRFRELEGEGIHADFERLADKFPALVRRCGGRDDLMRKAAGTGCSPSLKLLGRTGINFQNYDDSKKAYSAGYGIKFGEDLGVSSPVLENVRRLIGFRHRIVHVSPMIGLLNQPHVPPQEPIFSSREYADTALDAFERFIDGLHAASLQLRPG